jgi:hypothetical protein
MQRVHVAPHLGETAITDVGPDEVERLAAALSGGRSPKTVRNTLSFLHAVFEHAIAAGLVRENPVRGAAHPGRVRLARAYRSKRCVQRTATTAHSRRPLDLRHTDGDFRSLRSLAGRRSATRVMILIVALERVRGLGIRHPRVRFRDGAGPLSARLGLGRTV